MVVLLSFFPQQAAERLIGAVLVKHRFENGEVLHR